MAAQRTGRRNENPEEDPYDATDPGVARRYGQLLMAGAAISGALYFAALLRRSYWAIAVPVSVIVGGLAGAALVLGRLLATTPDEPPDPE